MGLFTGGNYPAYAGASLIDFSEDLTAATTTTAGAVVALANPLGVDLLIWDAALNITTAATTATNTVDVGVAANATTSSDTLFDGTAMSAGVKSPGGTNGARYRRWGASEYVTATASATLAGLVGTIHLVISRA